MADSPDEKKKSRRGSGAGELDTTGYDARWPRESSDQLIGLANELAATVRRIVAGMDTGMERPKMWLVSTSDHFWSAAKAANLLVADPRQISTQGISDTVDSVLKSTVALAPVAESLFAKILGRRAQLLTNPELSGLWLVYLARALVEPGEGKPDYAVRIADLRVGETDSESAEQVAGQHDLIVLTGVLAATVSLKPHYRPWQRNRSEPFPALAPWLILGAKDSEVLAADVYRHV